MSFRAGANFLAGAVVGCTTTTLWNHLLPEKKNPIQKERLVFRHSDKGYAYSGITSSKVDAVADKELKEGNFVTCSYKLPHQNRPGGEFRYLKVVLAGTKEENSCQDFHMLYEALSKIWGQHLSEQKNPITKERQVFRHSERGYAYAGTTSTKVDAVADKELKEGNFVNCSFKLPHQNRPDGEFRNLQVVLTGTKDENSCEAFHMLYDALSRK